MKKEYKVLRLILGDQLNIQHSWFHTVDDHHLYVLMELKSETSYVQHHIQKVIGFFLAMRRFKTDLEKQGHQVIYLKLDDKENRQTISENIENLIQKYAIERFEYLQPDEYRVDMELNSLCENLTLPTKNYDSEHFLTQGEELETFFAGKRNYLMENFYRYMRKKHRILIKEDGKSPIGEKWNYDQQNRKKLPRKFEVPATIRFDKEVSALTELLKEEGVATIGTIDVAAFNWPITREEALQALDHFLDYRLSCFGTYQDAMSEKHYLLYHSGLSFALNIKLIHPLEVVRKAEEYWLANQKVIDLAQVEGFIRQIIGWREYMRGIYWAKMPQYAQLNYFNHQLDLPKWYWTGNTKMNCLAHAIQQSLQFAYAHHIQRLMLTGNFALLLGVHPDQVDRWYLGIYIDAIEWVEITNTRGMSQYADGGIVGTKPYVSSANYIDKMSDYCKNCHYDKKQKYGPKACPFNSLFWDFYERHRGKLSQNPRIGMMYRVWDRNSTEEKMKILDQAKYYREHIAEV